MKTLIGVALSCLLLSGAADAVAQTSTRLTVDEAVRLGLEASHRLAEIEARRAAATAAVQARVADTRPVVSLQAGYTRMNHVDEFVLLDPSAGNQPVTLYADVPNTVRTRLDLQWPIYTGGRTDALARAARAEAAAVDHDRTAAQADLKLEITRAYWAVVTAGASVAVLEQALVRMDAHLANAQLRERAGLVPPTHVLSTQAQRSRQEMLLIEARNLQEGARADLRRLVGVTPEAPIDIDPTLAPPMAPDAPPPALAEQARAARPDRLALQVRLTVADETRAAAAAGRRPSLFLAGGFDYARPNPTVYPRLPEWRSSWDLSVQMHWALWDGGRVRANVAQATATHQAAQAGLREFDAVLESDIRQQRLSLESALAAIRSAEDGLRSATEANRVMTERYTAGIATNTDALDAQLAVVQAELDRTRAIANARLAAARLDRALGR